MDSSWEIWELFRRGTRPSTVDQGGEALDAHPGALALLAAREEDGVVLAASAVEALLFDGDTGGQLCRHLLGRGLFVELGRFALLDGERPLRADGQAEAGAVAELLLHDLGLAVDDLDGALGAGSDAEAAPVAELLIDVDDAADCHDVLAFSRGSAGGNYACRRVIDTTVTLLTLCALHLRRTPRRDSDSRRPRTQVSEVRCAHHSARGAALRPPRVPQVPHAGVRSCMAARARVTALIPCTSSPCWLDVRRSFRPRPAARRWLPRPSRRRRPQSRRASRGRRAPSP